MIDFLQTTEGIITAASIYLLIGLAWNLVFNACGYLNLAMGEFFILGAMFSYKCETSWGITSPFLVGPITVLIVGAIGFLAERVLLRPLKDRGLPPLVVTIGIALVLLQLANKLSSAVAIRTNTFINGGIAPGGVHIAYQELIVWGTAIIVGIIFVLFFTRTDQGRVMRACVDNRQGAENLGIKVATYATAAFTASAMLAALAAFVITPIQSVAYNSGDYIAIKAFMAVSVLGVGRNGGAVAGALLVAALEGYLSRYVSPDTANVVVLIGFIVILCTYAVRSDGGRLLPPWLRLRRGGTATEALETTA
jgi:branched-subunit amino acid ABC-type transport system permease component